MRALEEAIERFLAAHRRWQATKTGGRDVARLLDEARAALEDARARLAEVERLQATEAPGEPS